VTEFRGSIDELEGDLLEGSSGGLRDETLAEGKDSLLDTSGGTLDHQEVLVHDTIVGKAAHGSDGFLCEIDGSRSALWVATVSDAVDLLVDLGSVMVTVLTGTGDGPLHTTGMPSSDTSDLTETFVSLTRKTGGSPTSGDALETLTLGDSDHVDHLVLLKDGRDVDRLLKEADTEGDLLRNCASIDLNLHQVGLLLAEVELADLGMDKKTNNGAAAADALEVLLDGVLSPWRRYFKA